MRLVTFGEVMIRLAPEDFLRMRQVVPGRLEATFGGGEMNVAVSASIQGMPSAFLTALPDNVLTDALEQECGKLGVATDLVKRVDRGRFGLYFVETGANQRGGTVTYDREGSSIALMPADSYDWNAAFSGANWFHITGITPAISAVAAEAALASVKHAKQQGLTVSCDLNFRKKLWKWKEGVSTVELARETMRGLMPYIDVVIANEEDADLSLGIQATETDVEAGEINVDAYRQVAATIVEQFPNVSKVAITLRESISASHNNWGAMLYDAKSQEADCAPLDGDGRLLPVRNPQHRRSCRRGRLLRRRPDRRIERCRPFSPSNRHSLRRCRELLEAQHQRRFQLRHSPRNRSTDARIRHRSRPTLKSCQRSAISRQLLETQTVPVVLAEN